MKAFTTSYTYTIRCILILQLLLQLTTNNNSLSLKTPLHMKSIPSPSSNNVKVVEDALSSSSSSSPKTIVRVITYNVLSSNLGGADYFTSCDPKNLDPYTRRQRVMSKIKTEVNNSEENNKPIICLQEISHSWVGTLHTFFSNNNYHFVTALYGHKFNGYMGIGIAYPTDQFQTMHTNVCRLSDFRDGGWPRKPREVEADKGIGNSIRSIWKTGRGWFGLGVHYLLVKPMRTLSILPQPENPKKEIWTNSEYRYNELIFLSLKDKKNDARFAIANYHMPCAFQTPMVMTIHADLAVKRVQKLAQGQPFIFAGDFNILPDSSTYRLITTGELDLMDITYPTPKYGVEWKSSIENGGISSAYALSENGEPDFTNYAKVQENDMFIGTIDYIFLSKNDWNVVKVRNTPRVDTIKQVPLPNDTEPSDHIMISADLELS